NSPSNDSTFGDSGAIYEHDNNVVTDNLAFYTQGDLMINDQLSVTLGVRYSKDTRESLEARGGYSEIEFTSPDWDWVIPFAIAPTAPAGFDQDQFSAPGVTPLAALNVALGAATFTGDPENPIAPVCPLESVTCANPLRLGGLPISWGSRAAGEYETDSWSYRVNLNWTPNEDTLIYFGATTSYRAGGFNMGGPENRAEIDTTGDGADDSTVLLFYDDEDLIAWELGYKGTHFDSRLLVTAALYVYDYENYQDHVERWETNSSDFDLPAGIPSPSGRGPVSATTNIPEASNEGLEIDAVWLATDALTLGGNYSYTISEWDAKFTLFNENDPRYPREILGGDVSQDPCSLPEDIKVLYCLEADGMQLSGIPKHKATVWGSYEWYLSAGTLTAYASVAYTGEYFTSAFARPWDEVPERHRTDMRLSFLSADRRWNASLFVDNVFDDTYLRWSDMEPRRTGYGSNFPQRVVALAPRFVGFEFVYNFGS
ncbi:MAG: TonB-dependent receptor, partial [Pseudomonadales bacterium]|nr:TonB-dependent receptor [Pseudomonadales bacterium]